MAPNEMMGVSTDLMLRVEDEAQLAAAWQFMAKFGLIGAFLMRKAGYDVSEAAKVWENLALEILARPDGDSARTPLFATHPATDERKQALAALAESSHGGVRIRR